MRAALTIREKDIYEACYSLLVQLECATYRLSQARASNQTPGVPDLLAFVPVRGGELAWRQVWIEVKKPGGRQSGYQRIFQQACELAAIDYWLVDDAQQLADRIAGLRPTPTVKGNYNRKGASPTSGDGLATAVRRYTTPVADDTGHRKGKYAQGGPALSTQIGGPLSPTWVEWLMGFPIGHTDCDFSGIASSRKSRSTSAA